MENIRPKIKSFILTNFLPGEDPANLTNETELKESGILDSLATLNLVTYLEKEFNVQFEADDLDPGNLATLVSIENLVKSKMDG